MSEVIPFDRHPQPDSPSISTDDFDCHEDYVAALYGRPSPLENQ